MLRLGEGGRRVRGRVCMFVRRRFDARCAWTSWQGVKRGMKGEEARKKCAEQGHDLALIQVPVRYNKADMKIYRDAGAEVVKVLSRIASECHSGKCEIERASIDEVGERVCVERA
jgi:hypothetical protein